MAGAARFFLILVFLPSLCFPLFAAAAESGYKPGVGAVEKWMTVLPYAQVKSVNRPLCLYAYNSATPARNAEAKFLEGSDFLGNAEVQKKLTGFQCIKIDIADPKTKIADWPASITTQAKNLKFSVMLFSGGFSTPPVVFSHNGEDTVPNFIKACDNIVKYEAQKKIAADNAEKEKEAKEAKDAKEAKGPNSDNIKVNVVGLGDDKDKDKKKDDPAQNKPPPSKPSAPDNE